MDGTFVVLFGVGILFVAVSFAWQIYVTSTRHPALLRAWADANGWQLLRFDGPFYRTPFGPQGYWESNVYEVDIQDQDGKRRRGHVRIAGTVHRCLMGSSELTIHWDGAPTLEHVW